MIIFLYGEYSINLLNKYCTNGQFMIINEICAQLVHLLYVLVVKFISFVINIF